MDSHRYFSYGIVKGIAIRDKFGLRAFRNSCPHMGGPVAPCGKFLKCGWHGATFDLKNGQTQEGSQAPMGTCLEPISVTEMESEIFAQIQLPEDPFT